MKFVILISFCIAVSYLQITTADDPPPAPATATTEGQGTTAAKPAPIGPVLADNAYFYGAWLGNILKSLIVGDEYSVKWVLHKLLEGTEFISSSVASTAGSLRNSQLLSIHSSSPAETKKPET